MIGATTPLGPYTGNDAFKWEAHLEMSDDLKSVTAFVTFDGVIQDVVPSEIMREAIKHWTYEMDYREREAAKKD